MLKLLSILSRFPWGLLIVLAMWLAYQSQADLSGTLALLGTIWVPNLTVIYIAGTILGLAAGLFMTTNWALGTRLVPPAEAGRYLGISNLAGAGAGMIGSGIGGPMADYLNSSLPGLGYFALFGAYGVLFLLSAVSLKGISETGQGKTGTHS